MSEALGAFENYLDANEDVSIGDALTGGVLSIGALIAIVTGVAVALVRNRQSRATNNNVVETATPSFVPSGSHLTIAVKACK